MKVKSTTPVFKGQGSTMEHSPRMKALDGLDSKCRRTLREVNKMPFKHRRCLCSSEPKKKSKDGKSKTCAKKSGDKPKNKSKVIPGIRLSDHKAIRKVLGPKELFVNMVPLEVMLRSSPWRILKKRKTLKLRPNSFKPIEEIQLVPRDSVAKNLEVKVNGPPTSFQVCSKCARRFKTVHGLDDHTCSPVRLKHKIYRDGNIKVFKVDGAEFPDFCNNLILLARMYLNALAGIKHVTKFYFFTLYVESKLVGFFSRLKEWLDLNVAVIFILPQEQGNGFGRFLIDLSYELTKLEDRVGTPERPFSTAGHKCYLRYWCDALAKYLCGSQETIVQVKYISKATAIHPNDLVEAAKELCPEILCDGNRNFLNVFRNSEEKFVKSEFNPACLLYDE